MRDDSGTAPRAVPVDGLGSWEGVRPVLWVRAGTAAGALLVARIPPRAATAALVPSFLLLFAVLSFFPFGAPAIVKVALIALAVLPAAFFTGTFFPRGFFLAPTGNGPWYYAMDTIASAGAFLLFYLITAVAGFSWAGVCALLGYLAAGLILSRMTR